MRIVTWNVNGLRAALRKGFADHIAQLAPDVVLLQEVRALPEQLPKQWQQPEGWCVHWHPAKNKGYAGVAIWSRHPMTMLGTGMAEEDADEEGRVLRARIEAPGRSKIEVVSVYLPSGSSGEVRQAVKQQWMTRFDAWAAAMLRKRTPVVMGGDFNIAHTERDIFYARGNAKNSGFLPHERRWIGDLLGQGWRDFIREAYGDVHGPYSWWSNRGQAREKNRGWRIDYLLGNRGAGKAFQSAQVHREGGMSVSDHAPVSIDLDDG